MPVEEVEKLGAEVEIDTLVVKRGPLGQGKILVLAGEGPRVVKRARLVAESQQRWYAEGGGIENGVEAGWNRDLLLVCATPGMRFTRAIPVKLQPASRA